LVAVEEYICCGQNWNLLGQNWTSNSARSKLEYYFNEPQKLKKYQQLEQEDTTDGEIAKRSSHRFCLTY
jgi:hypothetical protein